MKKKYKPSADPNRLGPRQRDMIAKLRKHGHWNIDSKWHWDAYSGTCVLFDGLVVKGFVTKTLYKGKNMYAPVVPHDQG